MQPQKLQFRIISFTGEDREYPVTELYTSSPQSRGWQSSRFCEYPQEIILQFMAPIKIKQIQFLSHQSKIASKIDIYTYMSDQSQPQLEDIKYKKLGYLSLDSNERSGYQARELKSVYLDNPCMFMKLALHKCHINKYNLFNQVGLIALSVFGESLKMNPLQQINIPSNFDKLEYEIQYDQTTLDRLRVFQIAKDKAIKQEDFEEAKRIKEAMDRLKQVGTQLQYLEERKQIAVNNEDFDSARIIKAEIDKLRNAIAPESLLGKYGNFNQNFQDQDNYLPPVQKNSHRPWSAKEDQLELNQKNKFPVSPITTNNQVQERQTPRQSGKKVEKAQQLNKELNVIVNDMDQQDTISQKSFQRENIEQKKKDFGKKGVSRDINNPHDEQVIPTLKGGNNQFEMYNEGEFDVNEQKTSVNLEKLTAEQLKNFEPFIPFFGEEFCQKICSKQWNQREDGLKWLESQLKRPTQINNQDKAGLFVAVCGIVSLTIGDKIYQVSQKSMNLLLAILSMPQPKVQSRADFIGYIDQILNVLLERIGEKAELPESCFVEMARCPIISCNTVSNILIKAPIKGKISSAKHIAGRLNVLACLIREFGFKNQDIPFNSTVEFAIKQIEHSSQDVRKAVINVLVETYKQQGDVKLRPHLQSLRNAQQEILQKEFDKIDQKRGNNKVLSDDEKPKKEGKTVIETNIKAQGARSKSAINENQKLPKTGSEKDLLENNSQLTKIQDQNAICEFCGKFDKHFNDSNKFDIHLWKECPMLITCQKCAQVVEISGLNIHFLEECQYKKLFKKCPRCKESIEQSEFKNHTDELVCQSAKPATQANRCPLCHVDILPGHNGWIQHLVSEGCPNNERTLM